MCLNSIKPIAAQHQQFNSIYSQPSHINNIQITLKKIEHPNVSLIKHGHQQQDDNQQSSNNQIRDNKSIIISQLSLVYSYMSK